MKIIDAVWEKRNLGVTCYEIIVEGKDTLEDIAKTYHELEERQYMVVKVASSNYPAVSFFQEKGYTFIETAITMIHHLQDFPLNKRLQKVCDQCSWTIMENEDYVELERQIDRGIFKTDRVYVDPAFTREQAAHRYKMWIQDMIARNKPPYKVLYKGKCIGFFSEALGGVYDGYGEMGLGLCIQYAALRNEVLNGKKRINSRISGNNPAVLHIQQALGYEVKEMEYVFVKHTGKALRKDEGMKQ